MAKKKTRCSSTATVMIKDPPVTITLNEDPTFVELHSRLIEINKIEGIKGYILKNNSTAAIDLHNPAKLNEYALLLSETIDTCQKISQLFNLNITKATIEGTETKMLYIVIGENRLSIFMEKNVDPAYIFGRVSL